MDTFVLMVNTRTAFVFFFASVFLAACSLSRQIDRTAQRFVLQDSALQTAHVGISIFEPATGRWWYNWQGDKYFVPASNTKLATCYAAMKYLGDSLVGARYVIDKDGAVELFPTGDPTFLHSDFLRQPVFEKLKQHKVLRWDITGWQEERWGTGWSWNDYNASYMTERSPFPVYGNVMKISLEGDQVRMRPNPAALFFDTVLGYSPASGLIRIKNFRIERDLDENHLTLKASSQNFSQVQIPMRVNIPFVSRLLRDTLQAENVSTFTITPGFVYRQAKRVIHSQLTDSLLRPLMHRSDNFFAEQALLMVSNEVLGFMNDGKIIDTLLKTDFKDLPQKPRWADGSGLSRYNLFTPQDFVAILGKMQKEFGMPRLHDILPTGNEGTLANYYKADSTAIYAKTGTLSGVVALSGFLTTKKGKELIFSILVNNHQASATAVRRAVEHFVQNLRNAY